MFKVVLNAWNSNVLDLTPDRMEPYIQERQKTDNIQFKRFTSGSSSI